MDEDRMGTEGYDKEAEYFYRKNKELIEKSRKKLDADRAEAAQQGKDKPFWMVCPKCGGQLKEADLDGVKVDQCGGCGGLFFDKGEVELLVEGRQPKGLGSALKSFFK